MNLPSASIGTLAVTHGASTGSLLVSSRGWSDRSSVEPCTCTSARKDRTCAGQITGATVRRCEPVTSNDVVLAGSGGGTQPCSAGGGIQAAGARLKSTSASQMSLGDEMPWNHGSSWSTGLEYQASS